jgi:hypothetical protein
MEVVVSSESDACEFAEMLNVDLTGVRCGHGFDDFREAGAKSLSDPQPPRRARLCEKNSISLCLS